MHGNLENKSTKEPQYPSYSGISTFLRTPYKSDMSDIDIALVGVPFDGGVVFRPGARHGPREVRNQSGYLGNYNHQSKIRPFELCTVGDVGDVEIDHAYNLDEAVKEIELFYLKLTNANALPISIGGDHSISYPILKTVGKDRAVGLIHFDAHCDTASEMYGSKFHHGGPFRNAVEAGVLDPKRTIQIGIRGTAEPHWTFSYESGMRVVHIEEFKEMGIKNAIKEVKRVVGDGPTYISFDVDSLDPAFAPGTGTPEVGGMTTFEAQQMLRGLRGLNLVGGDVMEVAPPLDPTGITALAGATMLFEILCLLAESFDK
jgi:guanidinopropionase